MDEGKTVKPGAMERQEKDFDGNKSCKSCGSD